MGQPLTLFVQADFRPDRKGPNLILYDFAHYSHDSAISEPVPEFRTETRRGARRVVMWVGSDRRDDEGSASSNLERRRTGYARIAGIYGSIQRIGPIDGRENPRGSIHIQKRFRSQGSVRVQDVYGRAVHRVPSR